MQAISQPEHLSIDSDNHDSERLSREVPKGGYVQGYNWCCDGSTYNLSDSKSLKNVLLAKEVLKNKFLHTKTGRFFVF